MKTTFGSKRHHYLARVSVLLILAVLLAGTAGCDSSPHPSEDLEIRTWYDLDDVRDNLEGSHTLMNDLDSTSPGYQQVASPTANGGHGWQPIGDWHAGFTGSLDGQGYEIRDLFIDRPYDTDIGFFGCVEEGSVENVGLVDATVIGWALVGGLAAINEGTVSKSYATGNVTSNGFVGGLVGDNSPESVVSDSYFTGSVTGSDSSVGGLVGANSGTVSNSYATGSMTGNDNVGGLVGSNGGAVSNSYAAGSVIGDTDVGGLVGNNYPESVVSDSYFTGSVNGNDFVGGLVGGNYYSTVSNSHYNCDDVLINGESIITIGALFSEDFDQWLANDKFLDVNERLSQEDDYYLINDMSDFKELLAFGSDDSLRFRLTDDLDLGDEPNFYIPCLAGEFDGNGHKISSLNFEFDFVSPVGLFGYLAPGGKVTQVGVEEVNITGGENVGGLVGYVLNGTVGNCSSTGSVTGGNSVGGLLGNGSGNVSNSSFTGSVTGDKYVGGLAGHSSGVVSNSSSTGGVTSSGSSVGGLVGRNEFESTVSYSYATGSVAGDYDIGGLVGVNRGTVSNSYATGSVTGNWDVGGLVGFNGYDNVVSDCYSTGSVTGSWEVGGLVGENWEGSVFHSFWDTETSGQATSDGGRGRTTAEMQDIDIFVAWEWDIIAVANPNIRNPAYIWNIVEDMTYPFLSWQPI